MTRERRWITASEVAEILHISRSQVYRLIRNSGFPRPAKIGGLSRWDREEIDHWMEAQYPLRGE